MHVEMFVTCHIVIKFVLIDRLLDASCIEKRRLRYETTPQRRPSPSHHDREPEMFKLAWNNQKCVKFEGGELIFCSSVHPPAWNCRCEISY
jgi:hypothetical protein